MPREKTKIALPTEYEGRCSGDTRYISFHPTFGQSAKLPEDSKYPGYECRLPIPSNDEESNGFYNLTMDDLVIMGLKKLSTDLDGDTRFFDAVDQGAYERSGPYCGDSSYRYPIGDLDYDCRVTLIDFALLSANWMVDNNP